MNTSMKELNLKELGCINGGYIVRDGSGYTVIHVKSSENTSQTSGMI